MTLGHDDKSAGEELRVRDDVGSPIEGVAAIVNGAAAPGLVVNGAQKLPFGGAHLRTRGGGTGGHVEQEADYQAVTLGDEETAKLVQP